MAKYTADTIKDMNDDERQESLAALVAFVPLDKLVEIIQTTYIQADQEEIALQLSTAAADDNDELDF